MRVDLGSAINLPYAGGVPERRLHDRESQAASPQTRYSHPFAASSSDNDDGLYGPSQATGLNWREINTRLADVQANMPNATTFVTEDMVDKAARDSFPSTHLMIKVTVAMADNIQERIAKEIDAEKRSELNAQASENLKRFNSFASVLHSLYNVDGTFPTLGTDNRFSQADYTVSFKGEELGGWKW